MEFKILGPVEVWADGRLVQLAAGKQRAVLAILLLQANRVVSAERLIQLLWGDDAPETASNSLQVHVSQLRKALHGGRRAGHADQIVITQPPGYLLRTDPEGIDLGRFRRRVELARLARSQADWQTAAEQLREALSLWRGPALADLADESFVVAESQPLEELRVQALEDRIEAEMMLGSHSDLIGELEALVGDHPFRERLCAHLMLALYRAGRQAEASEVFYRVSRKLVQDYGIEPGPELQELSKRVLKQDPRLSLPAPLRTPAQALRHNLPTPLTSLVARVEATEHVRHVLSSSRLVTLTGVGGVGKSRLALEVASSLIDSFPDGVWLCALAGVNSPELVPAAVRSAVGIADLPDRSEVEVIRAFFEKRTTLLVIDNCEHLVNPVSEMVHALLERCPGLTVLASSREALGVLGERTWPVPPLEIPDERASISPEALLECGAVQLFCERANLVVDAFVPTMEEVRDVAKICRRLDGIPLAIELAAARLRTLSVRQILERLDDRFALLSGGPRTSLAHHQTLRATIDWSYELISEPERKLLQRLSVFNGGASMQAIVDICHGDEISRGEVVNLLTALVDKSLLNVDIQAVEPNYRMLETIRYFAAERLKESGGLNAIADRHLDWFVAVAEQAKVGLHGKSQANWLLKIETSLDDLRSALSWARINNAAALLRLTIALPEFWWRWGHVREGRGWLEAALSGSTEPSKLRGECLSWAGIFAADQGDNTTAKKLLQEGLALHVKFEDHASRGWAMIKLGFIAIDEGETDRGLALMSKGVEVSRQAGNVWSLASALNNLGLAELELGLPATTSLPHLEESLELGRSTGDDLLHAGIADSVAQVAVGQGDLSRARALWVEALELSLRLHEKVIPPYCLEGLARLAVLEGRPSEALELFGAAQSARALTGLILTRPEQDGIDDFVAQARQTLADPSASQAWESGVRMPFDEALSRALEPAPVGTATHVQQSGSHQ